MDDSTVAFLIYEAVALTALAVWLMTKRGRDAGKRLLAGMRHLYIVTPLRLLTGRHAPDYWRIRELERELAEDAS